MRNVLLTFVAASIPLARAHIKFTDPSMWGYHVRAEDFPYDNRPEAPLQEYTFKQWWFHGHLDYPPAAGKFFELPAGGTAMSQLACNTGATKFWADSDGTTDVRQGDYPCPGYPLSQFHTNGHDDLKGCALSIAYTSDVNSIKPEDLAIFSVNHECVWKVNTPFQIPKDMPPCPEGGCICAWHWIHSVDSGSAQMYMNGFRCKVTGSTANTPVSKPVVPKRCTGDLSKCNQGAQQPLYWFQAEGNNMFNGQYDPPYYLDEWGFTDGAQNGIFGKRDDTPSTSDKPTTSSDKPSSTPAGNKPESTPSPTPTPVNPPNNSNGGNGGNQENGGNQKPPASPSPSPSPSPTSPNNNSGNGSPYNPPGDVKGNTSTNTANPHLPSPSRKPCKKRNKRQELVSRHFKHKRNHAHKH
jgi:hypothetical protein